MSPQSLCRCGLRRPKVYHFPEFTECARGENRNPSSSSGTRTLAFQGNQKEISSCVTSLPQTGPPSGLVGQHIDNRERGGPRALLRRQAGLFFCVESCWAYGPQVCEPMQICMAYSFHSSYSFLLGCLTFFGVVLLLIFLLNKNVREWKKRSNEEGTEYVSNLFLIEV